MKWATVVVGIILVQNLNAEVLSLESYLNQVQNQNDGVKAAKMNAEAVNDYQSRSGLMYRPNLFIEYQDSQDEKPNAFAPTLTKTLNTSLKYGFEQLTPFGLSAKLYMQQSNTELRMSDVTKYYEARPAIEFSQSLWRNFFGKETRSRSEFIEANDKAKHFSESYKYKFALQDAETLYWRLVLARETVKIQKDAVDRNQKIYDWMSRRAKLQLADSADMLQSGASLQSKKLDHKKAIDDEKSVARQFNTVRGLASDTVTETLEILDNDRIKKLSVPEKMNARDDVLAAIEQQRAAKAQSELSRQEHLPKLEVFGSIAYNGQEASQSQATEKSLDGDKPTQVIGVRFSTPLVFFGGRERDGFIKEELAADLNYRRKLFEQDRDINNLTQKFKDTKERLVNYEALELAQKNKYEYERQRHTRGRTTLMQVLQFEFEYQQAQLGRLSTLADLLQVHSQLKLFGDNNESR